MPRLREHFRNAAPDSPERDSVQVIAGSPADTIVEYAVRVGADVVILGPHRRVGVIAEMGSTAASVVRAAPCPCLVLAKELRLPLKRVIVPIDLSEVAGGALLVGLSWASALRPRAARAHLTALHVTATAPSEKVEQEVHEEVALARARAPGAARVDVHETIASGSDPVEGILRKAASEQSDLLVMGTLGAADAASGLGSVSAAVERATPCPLLLVPPATWEKLGRTARRARPVLVGGKRPGSRPLDPGCGRCGGGERVGSARKADGSGGGLRLSAGSFCRIVAQDAPEAYKV